MVRSPLGQNVRLGQTAADAATGLGADRADQGIVAGGPSGGAVCRAPWELTTGTVAEIRLEVRAGGGGSGRLMLFQGPLLFGCIDQTQVVNASIHLRRGARAHEVRNGDGCQQTDNRDNDHNFHQRETCLAIDFIFHTLTFFTRCERCKRRV